jgi:hypothetical protein
LSARLVVIDIGTGVGQEFDASGDAPVLQLSLAPGNYQVILADGFVLERSVAGGLFEPVRAVLASAKTLIVNILPNGSTFISFVFLVANDQADGVLNVSFGVAVQGGQLVGTLFIDVADGAFEPYLTAPPPSFVAPYLITSEASISNPPTHAFFTGTVGFTVASDSVGVLAELAPGLAGGTLSFEIETRPDDSQRFQLAFTSAFTAPLTQFFLQTDDLQPRVPVNDVRIADDPVRSRFRAVIPFQLVGATGNDAALGRIDLQFQP